jgi:DNA-binding protein HU-beta
VKDPQDLFLLNSIFTNEKNHMNQISKRPILKQQKFIASVSQLSGLSRTDSKKAIIAITKTIQEGLKNGQNIQFKGFGTFTISHRKARQARNPNTGAKIKVPASKLPRFRVGKFLREAIAQA